MAFPIPDHLPRRSNKAHDVASDILNKIDQATNKSLTASLATSWVSELDNAIESTKLSVYERIHADLPHFDRLFTSSKSVQTRLQTLSANVDSLDHSISDDDTGIVPRLVAALTAHADLAQRAHDASTTHDALQHLLQCKRSYEDLSALVDAGELPEAMQARRQTDALLICAPEPLPKSKIMAELKRMFRATRDRAEEQLDEVYSRSIVLSPTSLVVLSKVQVKRSETVLSLSSILSSIPPSSLTSHLNTLRKGIVTHYIDHILVQPTSAFTSSSPDSLENTLQIFPDPPLDENLSQRLDTLTVNLTFICEHILSHLPASDATSFKHSLCRPITHGILNNVLVPSLPSSFDKLPAFLDLVSDAVEFESKIILALLGNDLQDTPIATWADKVAGHYVKHRRTQILEQSRQLLYSANEQSEFMVEVSVPVTIQQEVEVLDDICGSAMSAAPTGVARDGNDEWNFQNEEDAWGFDAENSVEGTASSSQLPPAHLNGTYDGAHDDDGNVDDAWGWNDDLDTHSGGDTAEDGEREDKLDEDVIEDNAWDDDPWADMGPPAHKVDQPPLPSSPSKPIKQASGLTKKTKKAVEKDSSNFKSSPSAPLTVTTNGHSQDHARSTVVTTSPGVTSPPPSSAAIPSQRMREPVTTISTETYVVSSLMKEIMALLESILVESSEFSSSDLFPSHSSSSPSSSSAPASILKNCISSPIDVFRAIYPVKFDLHLKSGDVVRGMRYSNDCVYLSDQLEIIASVVDGDSERVKECKERVKVLGASWFDDMIENRQLALNEILGRANGFSLTSDQERYDECENAVNDALREIRRVAQSWKRVLTKSKYYTAIGQLAEAALSRMLEDILSLPDIPEVESHRLSELCRIFNALEGLFVDAEDPDRPPFTVVWVPSWLKFSYLSELLEASMADILYLFNEGALVDFEIDELMTLVKALFADTQLRTNTISKIVAGHPTTTTT